MQRMPALVASLAVLCALSGPAAATPTAFSGTLSVAIATLPAVSVVATGVADVTRSGGAITAFALAGGTFATSVTIPLTDPTVSPITQIVANMVNGAGSFDTIPGPNVINNFTTNLTGIGSGSMAISGGARIGLFAGPLANLSVPFTSGGVNGVGLGGDGVGATSFNIGVTVRGAPWTTGTGVIQSPGAKWTATGFVSGNTVQLVSPTYISTTIGVDVPVPAFATLTLTFVPEPGTLLLISAGMAGLALAARRGGRR